MSQEQTSLDITGTNFGIILFWLIPVLTLFSFVYLCIGFTYNDEASLMCAGAVGLSAVCTIIARSLLQRARVASAAHWVGGPLIIASLAMTMLQPNSRQNYAVVPLLVAILIIQYTSPKNTHLWLLFCTCASIAIVVAGEQVHSTSNVPVPLMSWLQVSTFTASMIFAAIMLWHWRRQMLDTLHEMQRAHEALRASHQQLKELAIRDSLTGLFNRRYLEEVFVHELYRAERAHAPLSLMLLDIDHFKRINDQYGHAAGDVVLREVSLFLIQSMRRSDIICRYGGEELLVLMPDTSTEDASVLAEKVRSSVRTLPLVFERNPINPPTISIGVATFPDHGNEPAQLLRLADLAMYCAKSAGRNQVYSADAVLQSQHRN